MAARQTGRVRLRPAGPKPAPTTPAKPTNGATPAAATEGTLQRVIRAMLPERTAEDIMAGLVRIQLGPREVILPMLPIAANREWKAKFNVAFATLFAAMERPNANASAIMAFLGGMADIQLDMLEAYDVRLLDDGVTTERAGALPDRKWIEANVTEPALLTAILGVTAAAFPIVATIVETLRDNPDLQAVMVAAMKEGPTSTSGVPPSTDGRRDTSSAT